MATELKSMITKELRQTVRDKKTLGLLIVAPVIQLLVFGFAVNLDVTDLATVVADEDHTSTSRGFAAGLVAGDAFEHVGDVRSASEAVELVEEGHASIALVIPRGFGRAISEGKPTQVQVLVDGADSIQGVVSQNAVSAYGAMQSMQLAYSLLIEYAQRTGVRPQVGTIRVEPRTFYNPTLDSKLYFVPGIAATLLLVITVIVTALGLGREQEAGTLEQVLVTPISPRTFVLGKTLPYAFIGMLDLGLVVAGGAFVFDVPLRGNLLLLVLAGFLYMLTTLGIGLFAGTIAKSQQQAFMNVVFFIMPAVILSGFMNPIHSMPDWLQPVTALDPVRHFVEVLRAVLLKGATFSDISHSLVALAGMGLCVFPFAAIALQRKLR